MTEKSVNKELVSDNLKNADRILQGLSGGLEVLTLALSGDELSENAVYGMRSMLLTMQADIEQAGALIAEHSVRLAALNQCAARYLAS